MFCHLIKNSSQSFLLITNKNPALSLVTVLNTFPNNKFFTLPKSFTFLKEFADQNFELDENGRRFSKRVEDTVGKGEIAHYEQFLLLPQLFQKTCTADT